MGATVPSAGRVKLARAQQLGSESHLRAYGGAMHLNRLEVHLESYDTSSVSGLKGVALIIDGLPLAEHVREIEAAEIRAKRTNGSAGSYLPMAVADVKGPEHFLGHPEASFFGDGDTVLLGCTCGEWGCGPLTARIEVRDDVVEWHDFRRGFRDWDYDPLGRFIFDRSAYQNQFETIDWSDTGIPPGGW